MNQARKHTMPLFFRIIIILLLAAIVLYALLVGLVYYWEKTIPEPTEYDSIIVLGAQVKEDGQPSVQLRWRLNTAEEYYQKKPCPIVCCGAQGSNEPRPEGDVMRDLLVSEGVSAEHAFSDAASYTTRQNLENARAILNEQGCSKPLIVTSDYHVKRALALAKDMGINAEGAGSPCRNELNFWLKNHCREALAWVKYWGEKLLGRN